MKQSLIKRAAIIITALEIVYLAIFNLALNVPVTQDLVNIIKEDKFNVHWDSAWTPYPFRIHASGVAANGQTRGQQWQLETPQISASISLLPLLFKTVALDGIAAKDITYRQRPRPKADKDYSSIRDYFPPIQKRELEIEPPRHPLVKSAQKGWTIKLQNMHASGNHSLWFYQIQAHLQGEAMADLSALTRGGPISLRNGEMDIEFKSVVLNGNHQVTRQGHVKGTIELLPFRVKQHKGLKALAFMNLDVELDAYIKNLAFLNIYLATFEGMQLQGAGQVQGRMILNQGRLLAKSKLHIAADSLALRILDYQIKGDGNIQIQVPEIKPIPIDPDIQFAIAFNHLDAYDLKQADKAQAFLSGNDLIFNGVGSNYIIPLPGNRPEAKSMALTISSLQVPNLKAFQRFLPQKWAFKLHGGQGELHGQISVSPSRFSSDIKLSSQAADVGFNDFRFTSNLELALNLDSPSLETGQVDLSGTYLKLNHAEISNRQQKSIPWQALIHIDKGLLQLNLEPALPDTSAAKHILLTLKKNDISALIDAADEQLKISGNISDLRWLKLIFKNPYGLVINGKGKLSSNINIKSGWLAQGSEISVIPQEMSVEVLDYVANGAGRIDLNVTQGGEFPDLKLDISLKNAQFKRKLEDRAFIEDVDIFLMAKARGVRLNKQSENMQLRLQIPSALIKDMSVYNQYLPEKAPVQILAGQAKLNVDILLQADDAQGFLRLNTQNLSAIVNEQEISAALSADIKLAGGTPKEMRFDISGSTLKLDKVQVIGNKATFNDEDWSTQIHFDQAETVWKKPIQLDVEADIHMSDSMPLVSMLVNHKGKGSLLKKALIIEDVKGKINLQIANNQIIIPYAFASSDKLDVGAKAVINRDTNNGMVYVRYKALKALLKIINGKRNIDVLRAKKKFDAYSTRDVMSINALSIPATAD